MATSRPDGSYSYRDVGSFCHHVFKQNVIRAIRLSYLAAVSQLCKKSSDGLFSYWMPLGGYAPVLFPTYFNLCLTAAHITLNCALCNWTRKSLCYCYPVIFSVWMCPWGAMCVRQTYSSILPLSIITYCIWEEALGPVCVHISISFIHCKKKMLYDNFLFLFLCCCFSWLVFQLSLLVSFKVCVTDSFGFEPAQFAKQVVLLCS